MAKHKDPIFETLKDGRSFTWTMPEGGNLASMRAAIKHGQTLTMSPIRELREIQVGDIVLVQWHGGHIYHLVGEIQGDQFLIVNSVGKTNGWVNGDAILGRISKTVDPEPRPSLLDMLKQLEGRYGDLIEREHRSDQDRQRLLSIYALKCWIDTLHSWIYNVITRGIYAKRDADASRQDWQFTGDSDTEGHRRAI